MNTERRSSDAANLVRIRWALTLAGLAALLIGLYQVISPFVVPLLWAGILCLTTWPLYRWVVVKCNGREVVAALLMTALLALVLLALVIPLFVAVQGEARTFASYVTDGLKSDASALREPISKLPLIGGMLSARLESLVSVDASEIASFVQKHQQNVLEVVTIAARGVFSALAGIVMCLIAAYFFYLHGAALSRQITAGLHRVGGPRFGHLLDTVRGTVRGALYGVVATALSQGFLAGVGFVVAGAPTPLLLGLATVVLSLIPFGTPFVYVPVSIYLLTQGSYVAGLGLLAWGVGVVSMVDNLLRPFFISQATQMPILLVFIGVVGGVLSFGLIGLFVGPALIAVAQALWIEWVSEPPASNATLEQTGAP
jgi:predicted PurR-regulated permease PerM